MQVLNHAFLERQCFGDAALRADLLALYREQLESLSSMIADAEGEALQKLAHRLKGASLAIGADDIAHLADDIENARLSPPQAGPAILAAAQRFAEVA
jgi:HPt (histidine-containing phosphotransfer) domain-containing protein